MTPMHSPYWRSMLILGAVVLAGYGIWMAWEGWGW